MTATTRDIHAIRCHRCHRSGYVQLDIVSWWADGVHEGWGDETDLDEDHLPEAAFEEPLTGAPPTLCPACRRTQP